MRGCGFIVLTAITTVAVSASADCPPNTVDADGGGCEPDAASSKCPAGTTQVASGYGASTSFCERADGTRHGALFEYGGGSALVLAASYKDGKLDGVYSRWHENQRPAVVGAYRDGKRVGQWKFFDDKGTSLATANADDHKVTWREFYPDGKKSVEGELVDGVEAGIWTYFERDGNKTEEGSLSSGKRTGEWRFFSKGKVSGTGNYLDGKKHGLWISVAPNGKELSREEFENDFQVVICPANRKRVTQTVGAARSNATPDTFVDVPVRWGATFGWIYQSACTLDGVADGPVMTLAHSEGLSFVAARGNFVKGQKDGRWGFVTSDGLSAVGGAFLQGKPNGIWEYKLDGEVTAVINYRAGSAAGAPRCVDSKRKKRACPKEQPVTVATKGPAEAETTNETEATDAKSTFLRTKKEIMAHPKGRGIAQTGEQLTIQECRLQDMRAANGLKFKKACGGESECSTQKQAGFFREQEAIDLKVVRHKKTYGAPATKAYYLGKDFHALYTRFMIQALDCYCPDPANGDPGACKK